VTTIDELLAALRQAVGADQVLTDAADKAPFLTDWRGRYVGRALAVVKPDGAPEVAGVVRACAGARIPIVPQGGNTGLAGGATPDSSGQCVVVSLARMNRIVTVDTSGNTICAQAGTVLQNLQVAARDAGRLFPLSLASEGSCTLGGLLSTNAGGTAVLRYGNARELCLAIEAVNAHGEILGSRGGQLQGLRKDNTGYSLRDLLIGAEGTLGIITAAVMKLFPLPRDKVTAFVAVASIERAVEFLASAQDRCGATLTAFELLSDAALSLVTHHFPQYRRPFAAHHPYAILAEISDHDEAPHASAMLEQLMQSGLDQGMIEDVVIAQNLTQSKDFWALRDHISEAQAAMGQNIKHDVALPIARIAEFVHTAENELGAAFPGARVINFGHVGDGNLHFNVSASVGMNNSEWLTHEAAINRIVHDAVASCGGSISAEHGIGQLRRDEVRRYKPVTDLTMMHAIKQALDPAGIMNPGKVLGEESP